MLDLVPFARSEGKVTDGNRKAGAVGQLLEFPLPQAHMRAVAAPGVRGDEHRVRVRVDWPSHLLPPPPDGSDREACRIVVDAHADPPRIAGEIVDARGNGFALLGNEEIMHAHPGGLTFRTPLAPTILEVSDQLLLLGIHGDDRLVGRLAAADLLIDVPKLGIAIRMLRPFPSLAVGLQAVAGPGQEFGHQLPADRVAHPLERGGQLPNALGRPVQWRLRIARGGRLHQPLQISPQGRVFVRRPLASPAGATAPSRLEAVAPPHLSHASSDGGGRHARGARHARDATPSCGQCFGCRPQSPGSFRQGRRQHSVLRSAPLDVHSCSPASRSRHLSGYCLASQASKRTKRD
jgi:hypothetical protein